MNNIKKARMARGMSQAELGKAVGLSASTIGMIEQGRRLPSIRTLMKLRKVLGYSEVYLLDKDEEMEPIYHKKQSEEEQQIMRHYEEKVRADFLDSHGAPAVLPNKPFVSKSTSPLFKLLLMDDPKLAEIVNATKVVGEHDVISHGKLISISPAKLELFHAALKAILEIGG